MPPRTSTLMGSSQTGFVASPATGAAISPHILAALLPVVIATRPAITNLDAALNALSDDLETPDLVVLLENRLL